ncbi:OadG-related small transporter subunit [Thermoanaerobacterium sp. RBIITD]|nr:OadG-related small transporter subunit [Thermoanaerobacterium sp. RBIITD]
MLQAFKLMIYGMPMTFITLFIFYIVIKFMMKFLGEEK